MTEKTERFAAARRELEAAVLEAKIVYEAAVLPARKTCEEIVRMAKAERNRVLAAAWATYKQARLSIESE